MPAAAAVEIARQEWREAHLRLDEAAGGNAARREALLAQVEVITAELRRRIGQWFTLGELTDLYAGAEAWAGNVVAEHAPARDWVRTLSIVEGAAFHLYSRGAVDYTP